MSQTAEELLSSLNRRDIARRLQEYQALLANDSIGILVVCDGEIMQCNVAAARLWGWEQSQLLGRPASAVFSSEDEFQGFATRISDALAADGSPAVEWRTQRRDGARIWTRLLVKSITPGGLAGETVWMVENQIGAFILWNDVVKPGPGFRPELTGTTAIEPIQFGLRGKENAA